MKTLRENPSSYYNEMVDPLFAAPRAFSIRAEHLQRYLFAKRFAQKYKPQVVYDIACGDGYGTKILATVCQKIYGFDTSSEFLQIAKERYSVGNITYMEQDIGDNFPTKLPRPDAIVSFETLEHVSYPEKLLVLFVKLLPKGGYLLLSTPNALMEPKKQGKSKNQYHKHLFTKEELTTMVENAGFAIENIYGQPYTNMLMHTHHWCTNFLNKITYRSYFMFRSFSFLGKVTKRTRDKSYSIIVVAKKR